MKRNSNSIKIRQYSGKLKEILHRAKSGKLNEKDLQTIIRSKEILSNYKE